MTYGKEKDEEKKFSPYLVRWDKLREPIQDIDRNAVRAIPHCLAAVKKEVRRLRQRA